MVSPSSTFKMNNISWSRISDESDFLDTYYNYSEVTKSDKE